MKSKRIISFILTLEMIISLISSMPISVSANNSNIYEGNGFKVQYSVVNTWGKNQNIDIEITNTGTESIYNWAIAYDASGEISDIYNCKISKVEGTTYVLENVGYNSVIRPNQTVNFGYQLTSENPSVPLSYNLCMKRVSKAEGYSVAFNQTSENGSDVTGNITITNTTDTPIYAWELTFDGDFKINDVWDAKLKNSDNGEYTIKCTDDNSIIQPNSSVTFGLQCNKDNKIELNNISLSEVVVGEISDIPTEDIAIMAFGEYDIDTSNILISWVSSVPKGTFDVLVSYDGIEYKSVAVLSDTDTYSYAVDGTPDKMFIKIKQATETNTIAESEPFIMEKTEYGYQLSFEDTDNDGLPDILEKELGTDISKPDTDGDGLPDGYEYFTLGTDTTKIDSDENGISDANEDFDKDKLVNIKEYQIGTDPFNKDTDNDGAPDVIEVNFYNTDPLKYDTDEDGIGDGDEKKLGLDPLSTNTYGVPDNQYTVDQEIDSTSEAFSQINTEENPFDISLDITAAGFVEGNITVSESGYSNVMSNDAILGVCPELVYSDDLKIDDVVLKFKVDEEYISNEGSELAKENAEFNGIKRFNIFKYFEDDNMLLPVKTEFDVDNNTLYTQVDQLGTYCIIDMEKWLMGLEIEPKEQETKENIFRNSIDIHYDNTFPMENGKRVSACEAISYQNNSTDTSIQDELFPLNAVKMSPETPKSLVSKNNDTIDVVFIVYASTSSVLKTMNTNIINASESIFSKSKSARIYIVNANGSIITSNIGLDYASNAQQVEDMVKNIKLSGRNSVIIDYAYKTILDSLNLRSNSSKYCFNIDEYNSFFGSYGSNLPTLLESSLIDTSIINETTKPISLYDRIAKATGGELFYDISNFSDDIVKHIYGNIPKEDTEFMTILATGLRKVTLDDPLSNSDTDTDKDGLHDWDEVDTKSKLIKWGTDGSIILPTFKECIEKKGEELFYVKEGLKRFFEDNSGNPYYHVFYTKVLPIISDPTNVDGDGDFVSDYDEVNGYKTNPLTLDSDSDFLSDYSEINIFLTNPCVKDLFIYPIPVTAKTKDGAQSYISSKFGYRSNPTSDLGENQMHSGIDIVAINGTPIYATANGRVIKTNKDSSWGGGYGNYIEISHNNAYKSKYAHCDSVCISENDFVKIGSIIGYVGSTGDSTGNHLHFEIYENSIRVNPLNYISYHTQE